MNTRENYRRYPPLVKAGFGAIEVAMEAGRRGMCRRCSERCSRVVWLARGRAD